MRSCIAWQAITFLSAAVYFSGRFLFTPKKIGVNCSGKECSSGKVFRSNLPPGRLAHARDLTSVARRRRRLSHSVGLGGRVRLRPRNGALEIVVFD